MSKKFSSIKSEKVKLTYTYVMDDYDEITWWWKKTPSENNVFISG